MITLYANGNPQCELEEIERHDHNAQSGEKTNVTIHFKLSEPIETVKGLHYEIDGDEMQKTPVEPMRFGEHTDTIILRLRKPPENFSQ